MKFFKRLLGGAYNKALVPIVMCTLYLVNRKYGVDLPLSEDNVAIILTAVTSAATYQVRNHPVE